MKLEANCAPSSSGEDKTQLVTDCAPSISLDNWGCWASEGLDDRFEDNDDLEGGMACD